MGHIWPVGRKLYMPLFKYVIIVKKNFISTDRGGAGGIDIFQQNVKSNVEIHKQMDQNQSML